MATNDFLIFAGGITANVPTQLAWSTSPILTNGVQPGIADGASANKCWRQSSIMNNALGSFIVDKTGVSVVDDGTSFNIARDLTLGIMLNDWLIDTSPTVNVVAANLVPAFTTYTNGMSVRIKIATTNTGPATLDINGVGVHAIETSTGALIGGELISGNIYHLTWLASSSTWRLLYQTTAKTLASSDNSNAIATTSYVKSQGYLTTASAGTTYLTITNAGTTYLTIASAGTTYATIASLSSYAPLASPTFTGAPLSTTPTPGDNTTKIATTAFVATSFAPLASPSFTGQVTIAGPISTKAPTTVTTATYTVAATDSSLIFQTAAICTVTLPTPATYPGRLLRVKNIAAFAINSGSSNVVPLTTATAGTAIMTGVAGQWKTIQSDGTNWVVMSGN